MTEKLHPPHPRASIAIAKEMATCNDNLGLSLNPSLLHLHNVIFNIFNHTSNLSDNP